MHPPASAEQRQLFKKQISVANNRFQRNNNELVNSNKLICRVSEALVQPAIYMIRAPKLEPKFTTKSNYGLGLGGKFSCFLLEIIFVAYHLLCNGPASVDGCRFIHTFS